MTSPNGATPLETDNYLIEAIGQMGLQVDEMTVSVDRKIDTLLQETRQWEERQQTTIQQWASVTQQLTELLCAKTKETEGVASSYAQLAEYLMKFVIHLSAAEGIMNAVSEQLKHSSPSDSSSASTLTETQHLLAKVMASHEGLKEHLSQMLTPLQPLTQNPNDPKNRSIWTELFDWRPAIAWFSIGGLGVAVFLMLTLRMTGFNLAVRSLLSVDARLQRIEQFIGLNGPEDPNETAPTFEEEPFPDE